MKSVLQALKTSDLDLAIERMIELAGGAEDLVSESDSKTLGSSRVLKHVVVLLISLSAELDQEELIAVGLDYLSRLDTSVIGEVCKVYPGVKNDAVRRIFRRYLSEQAAHEADAIAVLADDPKRAIVKEAMGILFMGGEGSRAWRLLRKFAGDMTNLPRASLAQQVVSRIDGQKRVLRLFHAVERDDNIKLRIGAARTLWKEDGGKAMFVPIADLVMNSEFALREEKEIEAILKALVQLGGKRSVQVLTDLSRTERRLVVAKPRHAHMIQASKRWLETARALRE